MSDPLAFRLQRVPVATHAGKRSVLVVSPRHEITLGGKQIEALRCVEGPGALDRAILAAAGGHDPARALVFRASDPRSGATWGFDPELDEEECRELGYWLLRAQAPVYRRLMCLGVRLNLHVEWGAREVRTLREAVRRRTAELRDTVSARKGPEAAVAAADAWVLKHMTFYFSLTMERVMSNILPHQLPLVEAQTGRMAALAAQLPAEAVN